MRKRLPLGIDDFELLREENCLYVDKTEYIYKMVHELYSVFLSRPRRFGKSLLLSTIEYYFRGKKELFKGLAIESLEEANNYKWKSYPVFRFSFNNFDFTTQSLEIVLESYLNKFEMEYDISNNGKSIYERFGLLLEKVYNHIGLRCVILVDEYDKPFADVMFNNLLLESNKNVFRAFFGTLKSHSRFIRFTFMTGVTRYSHMSLFSGLNQLKDISSDNNYSTICGLTETELRMYLADNINILSENESLSIDECFNRLKDWYDGYHFSTSLIDVYNPVSIFNALYDGEFNNYWFRTGTPALLVNTIRNNIIDIDKFINNEVIVDKSSIENYIDDDFDLSILMYQTGYLTIKEYDKLNDCVRLGFPNHEVRISFLKVLLKKFVKYEESTDTVLINNIRYCLRNADLDKLRDLLKSLFAKIVYSSNSETFEHCYQSVMQIIFVLTGESVVCEYHTFSGRIDCKVETDKYIYLFELKVDKPVEDALTQIENRHYSLPFIVDNKKIFKIGVVFNKENHMLTDWKVIENGE